MSDHPGLLQRIAAAIYNVVLGCFPSDVRKDGDELRAEFRAALRSAAAEGPGAVAAVTWSEIWDLLRNLVPEWTASLRSARTGGEGGMILGGVLQDVHFAVRSLRRKAPMTAAIVATMAIAIGGTTATFGVVDAVIFEPLPYPDSERLVYLSESFRGRQSRSLSLPNYLDWRSENRVFEDLAAHASWNFTLTGRGDARALSAMLLTPNALEVLEVDPLIGRMFNEEETAAKERVVLLSSELWRAEFGADQDVLGRTLTLSGEPHTVIGVLPPNLEFPISGVDLWAPITMLGDGPQNNRGDHPPGVGGIGRLQSGVTLEAAREDLERVTADLATRFPLTNAEAGAVVSPIMDLYVGSARNTLYLFLGAMGLVLLIACANVANLLLVQSTGRTREAAVRMAMGAPRRRIVRLVMIESLLLASSGGALGVVLAGWGLQLVRTVQPGGLPRLENVGLDPGVLAFALVVSLVTPLIFGLGPALQVSSANPVAGLGSSRGQSDSRKGVRTKRALIVFEMASAFVLLVGAGLMIRSVDNLLAADAGIATSDRLTFRAEPSPAEYASVLARATFYRQLVERIADLPGVLSVAGVDPLPLSSSNRFAVLSNDGFSQLDASGLRVDVANITPGYFDVMDLPLLAGDAFSETTTSERPEVIVDQKLADILWPDGGALGRQVRLLEGNGSAMTVVGVAPHVNHYGVRFETRGKMYFPYTARVSALSVVVQTTGDPYRLVDAVKTTLSGLDADIPLAQVTTLGELRAATISRESLSRRVLQAFGLMAVALATLGLYGVLSYSVAQRRREIGIRMALGAQAWKVLTEVLREGMLLSTVGVVVGLVGAFAATRLIQSLLYGVAPFDLVTLGGVGALLMAVAVGSAALPASRAVRVDPSITLRGD